MEQCSVHTTYHAYVVRNNVCGYEFTLEQFNETCSKENHVWEFLCLHVVSILIHLGPK